MREHRGPLDFRRQQPVAKDSNVQGQGRCLLPFFQELSFLLDLLEAKADVPVTGRREASCHSGFCRGADSPWTKVTSEDYCYSCNKPMSLRLLRSATPTVPASGSGAHNPGMSTGSSGSPSESASLSSFLRSIVIAILYSLSFWVCLLTAMAALLGLTGR